MTTKYCCEVFRMSVIQGAFTKSTGLETELGKWKTDVYLWHKTGDKLYPTMFNEKGEPQLYQYENTRPMIMQYCFSCGKKLDN